MPKLPPQKSLLFFLCNSLRRKWISKLTFCIQISMKTYYKLILWFWWRCSSISKVPKIASLQCMYNISKKKKTSDKLIFCMQINIKVDYKLISTIWAPNLATRWYYDYWLVWWSILKLLKVTTLQIFGIFQKS